MKQHNYEIKLKWTGNEGHGTQTYKGYRRDHTISSDGKPALLGSSDPSFRGDGSRYNPEELLVAALSSCHMLSYLHLCAVNRVVVVAYTDHASGTMQERGDGSGVFTRVSLQPRVTIATGSDRDKALALHEQAHHNCYIAGSVNFPVETMAQILAEPIPET